MTIKQIGAATAISLAGVTAALAIGAGSAAAAPIEDCTVASDRPVHTRPAPTVNPLTDVPVIQQTTTVHVALNC